MKISIYDEKLVEKEQEVFLKLSKQRGLDIFLIVVNSKGRPLAGGNLLRIHSNLEISRCCSINTSIGIPLDLKGQLKIKGISD